MPGLISGEGLNAEFSTTHGGIKTELRTSNSELRTSNDALAKGTDGRNLKSYRFSQF